MHRAKIGAEGGYEPELLREFCGSKSYCPPEMLAARLPGVGAEWQERMKHLDHYAQWCAQVRMEAHGRIDGAINLVGSILLKPAHATSPAEFDDTLTLNLKTAFYVVRAAAKAMQANKAQEGGSIVVASRRA